MSEHNKLVRGMLIGAFTGAALSMLDRETRKSTVKCVRQCSQQLWSYTKNPTEMIENMTGTISNAKNKIEGITEDIIYIVDKLNQVQDTTSRLKSLDQESEKKEDV